MMFILTILPSLASDWSMSSMIVSYDIYTQYSDVFMRQTGQCPTWSSHMMFILTILPSLASDWSMSSVIVSYDAYTKYTDVFMRQTDQCLA